MSMIKNIVSAAILATAAASMCRPRRKRQRRLRPSSSTTHSPTALASAKFAKVIAEAAKPIR